MQQPGVLEKACSLDKVATALILQGFIAYGWTYKELSERPSRVINRLRSYIDVTELALQHDIDAITLHYPLGCTLLTPASHEGGNLTPDNARLNCLSPGSCETPKAHLHLFQLNVTDPSSQMGETISQS